MNPLTSQQKLAAAIHRLIPRCKGSHRRLDSDCRRIAGAILQDGAGFWWFA